MSNKFVEEAKITLHFDSDSDETSTPDTKYHDFTISEGKYFPNSKGNTVKKLKPGSYSTHYDTMKQLFWFEKIKITNDEILDLPSQEYNQVVREMELFLQKDTEILFEKLGYIYKRSTLLFGNPGTGKTILVNRIAKEVIKNNGIVLWVTNPATLVLAFDVLKDIQPNTLTCVIFEEFDSLIQHGQESMLLTLLDGQIQKRNVIYLATTNYIEKIPSRLRRPGRFSSVIEVGFPSKDARKVYLIHKLGEDFKDLNTWVEKTENLSIDELKEMIQSVHILKNDFDYTLNRILSNKDIEEEPIETKSNRRLGYIGYNEER